MSYSETRLADFSLWALVTGGALVLYVVYERLFSPLAGVPGPFWASLSRLWLVRLSWLGDTHRVVPELHKKYGTLVRIAPNEVSIVERSALKKIYGPGTKFRKSDWYSVFQGHRTFDLFGERDEVKHGKQRSLVSRPYSKQAMSELEEYVEDAVTHFFKCMEAIRDKPIDMARYLQLFAFDVIGEITFSKRFGLMDSGQDDESFQVIHDALRSGSWLGQVPWLFWLHERLLPLIGNRLAVNARHGSIRDFAMKQVNARKDRGSDHKDILAKLFEQKELKGNEMDDTSIMSMAGSNIFAGSDTTAIYARAVVYYLLKNPHCKAKLVQELDERWTAGTLSDPVKVKEADTMPYLQAVLYEALRCHPSVGMSLPRIVPAGGFEAAGRYFPAGTIMGTNAWAIHQDKEIFGQDADKFNPDRWLREDVSEMLTLKTGAMASSADEPRLKPDVYTPMAPTKTDRRHKSKRKQTAKTSAAETLRMKWPSIPEEEPGLPSQSLGRIHSSLLQDAKDFIVLELAEGERIPCQYPYEVGLEYIQARVEHEFQGLKTLELMRVVFDLIENKDNAGGIGDDGDCFAPWRSDHFRKLAEYQGVLNDSELSCVAKASSPHFPNYYPTSPECGIDSARRESRSDAGECSVTEFLYRTSSLHTTKSISKPTNDDSHPVPSSPTSVGDLEHGISKHGKNTGNDASQPLDSAQISDGLCCGTTPAISTIAENLKMAVNARRNKVTGQSALQAKQNRLDLAENLKMAVSSRRNKATGQPAMQAEQTMREIAEHVASGSSPRDFVFGLKRRFSKAKISKEQISKEHLSDSRSPRLAPFTSESALQLDGSSDNEDYARNEAVSYEKSTSHFVVNGNELHVHKHADNKNNSPPSPREDRITRRHLNRVLQAKGLTIATSFDDLPYQFANNLLRALKQDQTNMNRHKADVDPPKYNPGGDELRSQRSEDAFDKYRSVAESSPYRTLPTHREGLAAKESRFPPAEIPRRQATYANEETLACLQYGNVPGPKPVSNHTPPVNVASNASNSSLALLGYGGKASPLSDKFNGDQDVQRQEITRPLMRHQRSKSEPLTPTIDHFGASEPSPQDHQASQPAPKSTARRVKPHLPKAITTQFDLNRHRQEPVSDEQLEVARRYQVEVRDQVDGDEKVVRSPLKKLFGEHGILGRTNSAKDRPDPRYKRPALAQWSEKLHQFADGVKTQFAATVNSADQRGPPRSRRPGISTFPISLAVGKQAKFYMEIDVLLQREANLFLLKEYRKGNLSVESVQKVVKYWRGLGRAQVTEFRYDLSTQRELVALNVETIDFAGVNALNPYKIPVALNTWKGLAREISIRTYCQGDSAVKKQMHDAQLVLDLMDPDAGAWNSLKQIRDRVLEEISDQFEKDRENARKRLEAEKNNGVTKVWPKSRE
ncbi:MAG: hypothetical protein M1828_007415 [Chrysothrix sp. TS-e1954]|nr:MAG: hypothetical protein M1828_007415 [Chrysothrix sp. TS-e1954]